MFPILDIFCAIWIIVACINGFRQGFLASAPRVLGLFLALGLAWFLRIPVGSVLQGVLPPILPVFQEEVIGFMLSFCGVGALLWGLQKALVNSKGKDEAPKEPHIIDKLLGIPLKVILSLVILFAFLFGMEAVVVLQKNRSLFQRIAPIFSEVVHILAPKIPISELRLASQASDLMLIVDKVSQNSAHAVHLANHPEVLPIRSHAKIRALREDPELQKLVRKNNISDLLSHPKIKAAIQDPQLRQLAADIDWKRVKKDLKIP